MKTILFFLFSLFLANSNYAQTADERLGTLINQQKYFELHRQLLQTDSTNVSPVIWHMSNAFVNTYFYNPTPAIQHINALLANHQEELGYENTIGMVYLLIENYTNQREYKKAADMIKQLRTQLPKEEKRFPFESDLRCLNALSNAPKQEIMTHHEPIMVTLNSDVKIITVPVARGNKEYQLVMDTGANYSAISESIANNFNVRILGDSVIIQGFSAVAAKIGVADTIFIGNTPVYNMLFFVIPDSLMLPIPVNIPFQYHGCIGWDLLRMLKAVQIKGDRELSLDIENKIDLKNLMVINKTPYVECYSGDDTLFLKFDTGANVGGLSSSYYQKNKHALTFAKKDTISKLGGIGGYSIHKTAIVKNFPLRLGDNIVIPEIYTGISGDPEVPPIDGVLGQDVISLFDRLIIDFEKMTVILKKD